MTPSQQSRHVVQVSRLDRQTGAYKSQIVPRKMQKVPIDLKLIINVNTISVCNVIYIMFLLNDQINQFYNVLVYM